ncbi:MAG TPA: hypothetical protein VLB44_24350 [Kofleriaceae bacterium]|nr:hypothetical protein [Kofleriaceae bacterium]
MGKTAADDVFPDELEQLDLFDAELPDKIPSELGKPRKLAHLDIRHTKWWDYCPVNLYERMDA